MKIELKEFAKTVEFVAQAATGNMRGSGVIAFENRTVCAFNQMLAIQAPINADLSCVIKTAELLKILKKNKKADILEIKQSKKELLIYTGKTKYTLSTYQSDIYTDVTSIFPSKQIEGRMVTDQDIEAMESCLIPEQVTNNQRSGVSINSKRWLAADSQSMSQYSIDQDIKEIWISRESAEFLLKLMKANELSWRINPTWLYASVGDKDIAVRGLNLNPNPFNKIDDIFDSYIEESEVLVKVVLKDKDFLERIDIDNNSSLMISIVENKVVFMTHNLRSKASEQVEASVEWIWKDVDSVTGYCELKTIKHMLSMCLTFEVIQHDGRFALLFYNDSGWTGMSIFSEHAKN